MALAQTQALLARLYTDARLRRDFFDAPAAVAARFGVESGEAQRLAAIDRREVEAFAHSLLGKRALDARKALPLTARALSDRFDALFREAIAESLPEGRHRADAAALTQRLEALAARGGFEPAWIADLARFELAFVFASTPGATLIFRRFHYDVGRIAVSLSRGAPVCAVQRGTFGIWARAPKGRLRWRLF